MILFCHFNCNTKLTIPTLAKCGSLIGGGLTAANIKEKLFMPKDNTNKYATNKYAGKVIIDESLIDKRLQPLLTTLFYIEFTPKIVFCSLTYNFFAKIACFSFRNE